MKLINLIGPIADIDRIAMRYVIDNNVHLEDTFKVFAKAEGLNQYTEANPYGSLMKLVSEVADMAGIDPAGVGRGEHDMPPDEVCVYCTKMRDVIGGMISQRNALTAEIENNLNVITHLEHIASVDMPLQDIFNFHHIKIRFGRLPLESYKKLNEYISAYAAFFFKFGEDKDTVYGLYCAPVSMRDKVDALFSSLYFERMWISDKVTGLPKDAIKQLNDENIRLLKALKALNIEYNTVVAQEERQLLTAYRSAYYLHEAFDVRKFAAHTAESFYIAGWVPESCVLNLAQQLDAEPNVTLLLEEPDIVGHIQPPTKLKNNWFVRPFEGFVNMYGLPSYNEFDPTMLFALTYSLMFGMMYGDVGHGAALALCGVMLGKKGNFLGPILKVCGIVAACFGVLYGSVFGFELEYGFMYKPMKAENMMLTLGAAVAMGALIITLSMVFNMANGVRQKNAGKVLFDANGLAGFVFYWAVIIGVLSAVMGSSVMKLWYVVIFVAVPLLLVFFKHPLSMLIQRSPDWMPKNKGEFILENFFELFELILSYITNTISFIRVGAFALIHAGMMMVVYSLADVGQHSLEGLTPAKVLVLVIGNAVVIGLEGLLVAIQVLRLEFYEMFSRFFDGEGKLFTPRTVNSKQS